MRVFKFYSGKYQYCCAGKDENMAKNVLFQMNKDIQIDKVEHIPEKEWDNKIIKFYNRNISEPPIMKSINDIFKEEPLIKMLYTNDRRLDARLYMAFQLLIER